jgi:tetratricopeptide (TPR) repeat protein
VLKPGKSFYDFRPGMVLSDYMTTFLSRYKDADEDFIMASHADRLKQSPCFINTSGKISEDENKALRPYKNALTCVTCHNPHVSVKQTGTEIFNNACRSCHSGSGKKDCSEEIKKREKLGDNCVSCHMPKSGSIDIPHVTVHDHYIRKPVTIQKTEKLKKFIALAAVNEKSPSPKIRAIAYLQQYDKFEYNSVFLDSAQSYLKSGTMEELKENFGYLVHLNFMRGNKNEILVMVKKLGLDYLLNSMYREPSIMNSGSWTLYRIGESFYSAGDVSSAQRCYAQADKLAPYYPEFKNKLGVTYLAQNNAMQAIEVLEETIKENPKYVLALNNLGYAYLVAGMPDKAESLYTKAYKLDPDYVPLLMNIAGLKAFKMNYTEAKEILNEVLQKDPENQQALQALQQLKSLR